MTTQDGLPTVTSDTLNKFMKSYLFYRTNADPEVHLRMYLENAAILTAIRKSMEGAPNPEAREYLEQGMQIAYELLRMQAIEDKKETSRELSEDKGIKALLSSVVSEKRS